MSVLQAILLTSFAGGLLSVALAAFFALNLRSGAVTHLISFATGALLAAVFLEILPQALILAADPKTVTVTVLAGILLFFILEKLVLWRHCHGQHCEVHALHSEAECPTPMGSTAGSAQQTAKNSLSGKRMRQYRTPQHQALQGVGHSHAQMHPATTHGRSGMMIMIGDTFHNLVDGVLIAAAFMADMHLGIVTASAIVAHEIPQEVGDFLILLHSGYSKRKALCLNLLSSLATLVGGLVAYYALQTIQEWIPYILSLAGASLLYVAVADLIPTLHKRSELSVSLKQIFLLGIGICTVWGIELLLN